MSYNENTSSELAIEVVNFRKVYGNLVAVDDVSFGMYRGETFGFLGPNGAGKSTTVKALTGLIAPTAGTIRVLGLPVQHVSTRRRVGYLPELPAFHRWLKAREFLEFHGRLYGLSGLLLKKRCQEVLTLVGLGGREKQKLGTFSKGMLQRIGLAQALINQPDVLILDELVTGLDPVGQRDMREILLQLKSSGVSIFLNSHQLAEVEMLCDRVAIINQGRILKTGTPRELLNTPTTLEVSVDAVTEQLLLSISDHAQILQQDDPRTLLLHIEDEEQVADIADIIQASGARLYALVPRRESLEQIFFHAIDTSNSSGASSRSSEIS
ncbi:MAG: ABC transporter ATP-binding protein [Ktedonobacteraceae bacterium]|nr:ABC transporter ATP-binding protein [Ktedonobacteraceae bacterium]